jgi:hypothetical protein
VGRAKLIKEKSSILSYVRDLDVPALGFKENVSKQNSDEIGLGSIL